MQYILYELVAFALLFFQFFMAKYRCQKRNPMSETTAKRRKLQRSGALITSDMFQAALKEGQREVTGKKTRTQTVARPLPLQTTLTSDDDLSYLPPPLPQPLPIESTSSTSRAKKAKVSARSVAAARKQLTPELDEVHLTGGISQTALEEGWKKTRKRSDSHQVAAHKTLAPDIHLPLQPACSFSLRAKERKVATRSAPAPRKLLGKELNGKSCLYCNEPSTNDRSRERWLRCRTCMNWAHNECAGISPSLTEFVCELCT
jgi:hypothetical protein